MSELANSRPQPEYPCGQQDLYTIVVTGWVSYAEQLPRFENLSTNYTAATGTDQLAAVEVARAMPDEDSREEVHKTLRIHLKELATKCLIKWSDMGTYIRDGFPEEEYENKRVAAGYNYYAAAEHQDWDAVKGLMQNGLLFLNGNATELSTPGGMPATFIADFDLVKKAFELKHQAFLQAEEEAKVLTDQKILANNELFRAMSKMFEDGKKIFRENAALREQFTFDRVWELVKGTGGGTGTGVPSTVVELGVYVFDEETELPLDKARFTVLNAPNGVSISAVSGPDGLLKLKVMDFAANETVILEAEITLEGYETQSGSMEVTAGNFYSIDVPMKVIVEE